MSDRQSRLVVRDRERLKHLYDAHVLYQTFVYLLQEVNYVDEQYPCPLLLHCGYVQMNLNLSY